MRLEAVSAVFVFLLGLCVGSFLNVVIYRLPRELSIRKPSRSFCPRCRTTLRAADNIPLLSWLLLRGRCRQCGAPISVRYPLIEATTGLVFVLVYHLLLRLSSRSGLADAALPLDAPLLIAWLTLAAALVATSALDITSYMLDIRVTNFAMCVGIAAAALWPRPAFLAHAGVDSPACAAAVAAGFVSLLMLWRAQRREAAAAGDAQPPVAEASPPESDGEPWVARLGMAGVFVALAVALWIAVGPPGASGPRYENPDAGPLASEPAPSLGRLDGLETPAALLVLLAVLIVATGLPREADQEIHDVIEGEAPEARRMAAREVVWLAPAVGGAALVYALLGLNDETRQAWSWLTAWAPLGAAWPMTPIGGAAFAIQGAVVAAALGWAVRIVFTLALGREAFGVGDIYILAAAGAVTGWDVALLGALLAVMIALAAWILGLMFKRGRLAPFGPPLALGFLCALWLSRPAEEVLGPYGEQVNYLWNERPLVLMGMGAVLCGGGALSILVARALRRIVEPARTRES